MPPTDIAELRRLWAKADAVGGDRRDLAIAMNSAYLALPALLDELEAAREALAATPAQSLAAHDAALLRVMAAKLDGEGHPTNEYYRNWLMAEADRIEREESESKNGEENDRQTQDNKCIG